MTDIGLNLIKSVFQPKLVGGDLVLDEGLETAVIISLFSDARVTTDELPQGIVFKRGYWGDMIPDKVGDVFGSKLWIYDRSKITNATIAQVELAAATSLQWLIDDKIADTVIVAASRYDTFTLILQITITKPGDTASNVYGFLWDGQELRRA